MKKFLVKFIDRITGKSVEQVVESDSEFAVRKSFLENLRPLISVIVL